MQLAGFMKRRVVFVLIALCCAAGCKDICSDNSTDNSTAIVTASPENGPAVQAAVSTAVQMLGLGIDIETILTSLEDQLADDPRVYDVEVEPEIESVSMVFIDGETHTIRLTDVSNELDKGSDISSFFKAPAAYDLERRVPPADSDSAGPVQQEAVSQGYYRMPANNKALLLNGYVFYHGKNGESKNPDVVLTDSTELTEEMLTARGYDVERPEGIITVGDTEITIPAIFFEDFKTLSKYGVIVIETHGGKRDLEYPTEFTGKENCGGDFSRFKLLTTEAVTPAKLKKYGKDVFCGRLPLHDWIIREEGKKPRLIGQFFEVTPNYIRQYDNGTFSDNSLMILNACSAYNAEMGSPMRDVFFEKSMQGACFLGWNGKALVAGMGRASLNLFQLMTASNKKLTVKKLEALKESTPPQGGLFTALDQALYALDQQSYLADPETGAQLKLSKQDSETNDLILMPHPLEVDRMSESDPWQLNLFCAGQPTATVGTTEVFMENIAGSAWELLSVPVGAYGAIVISDGGRKSIPRTLHRWKPQIKIKSTGTSYNGMPFMQLSATLTLHARATIGSCFRDSVWNDPPLAIFDAPLDLEASNIAWTISGAGTDEGGNHYQYSGSGLETLKAKNGSGSMWTADGLTLSFQVCCDGLSYTWRLKGADGSVGTGESTTNMCVTLMDGSVLLEDDWTVAGGTYQDQYFGLQVDWNAFAPEPLFDMNGEPR